MEHLAEKIQALRKKNHLSQDALASKIGVTRQAISKWERGEGLPDLFNIKALAKAFDISIDDLLESPHEANEPKHKPNKLAITLLSIPGFLFAVSLPILFIISLITIGVLLIHLFQARTFLFDINTQTYIVTAGLIISFMIITLYKRLFTKEKPLKERMILIIIYGFFILGYLLLLMTGQIAGFSLIFLYIVGLLILISGLVGAILYDHPSVYPLSQKATNAFRIGSKVFIAILITMSVLIPMKTIKDNFLLKSARYLDEVSFYPRGDDAFFLDLNPLGDDYQLLLNYKIGLPENITDPYVSIYINDRLLIEGELVARSIHPYNYQFYVENDMFEMNPIYVPKDSETFHVTFRIHVSYTSQHDTRFDLDFYPEGDMGFGYSTDTLWIWDYNDIFN